MTQEQLAEKTGTKKSFISRIENGHSDIQLSTLYRLPDLFIIAGCNGAGKTTASFTGSLTAIELKTRCLFIA